MGSVSSTSLGNSIILSRSHIKTMNIFSRQYWYQGSLWPPSRVTYAPPFTYRKDDCSRRERTAEILLCMLYEISLFVGRDPDTRKNTYEPLPTSSILEIASNCVGCSTYKRDTKDQWHTDRSRVSIIALIVLWNNPNDFHYVNCGIITCTT